MSDDILEFQAIHASFRPRIHRYLTRLVGEAEAEDLTQEVFLRVHRALPRFRGDSQLSTWIYRIATNAALDRRRGAAHQLDAPTRQVDDRAGCPEAEVTDCNPWTDEPVPSTEQQLVRREMNACIGDYVEQLPENYRAVLVLGDMEGLSNKEVAAVLGLTLGTVKIRLHRGREKLRQILTNECDSYWVEENEFVPDLRRTRPR